MGSKALFRVSLLMRWSRRTFISILVWDSVQTCRPRKTCSPSVTSTAEVCSPSLSRSALFIHEKCQQKVSECTSTATRYTGSLLNLSQTQVVKADVSGFNLWLSYLKRFKIVFVITTCSRLYLALDAPDTTLPGYSRCEWRGICSQRCVWQQNDGFNKHSKLYLFVLSCWFSEMFYQIWPHDPSCYPEVQ